MKYADFGLRAAIAIQIGRALFSTTVPGPSEPRPVDEPLDPTQYQRGTVDYYLERRVAGQPALCTRMALSLDMHQWPRAVEYALREMARAIEEAGA